MFGKAFQRKYALSDQGIKNAKAGDLILLAGKGHEQYEIVGGERRPFCEGSLVKEAFRARLRAQNGEEENEGEPTV